MGFEAFDVRHFLRTVRRWINSILPRAFVRKAPKTVVRCNENATCIF
ncbi:hypothetical protein SALB1_2264 [Salinisphaera sp. LB1]|nr:hypothetical protein SALB1_2264 [Salinisphaera sp. LB1]